MRRIYILTFILILFQSVAVSQKFYIQASGGYSFGFLRSTIAGISSAANISYDTIYDEVYQYEAHPFSGGSAASFNLGIGVVLTEYLNIELTGFYNPCKRLIFKASEYYYFPEGRYYFDFNAEYIYRGNEYGFVPAMKFHFTGKKVNPYAKIGAIISFINLTYDYDGTYITTHPYFYPTASESFTYLFQRNLNIGINAAVGVDVYLADRLFLFMEATGNFINYVPNRGSYTKYKVNGEEILSDMTVSEREVEYAKNYQSTDNTDSSVPQKQLRVTFPFSSLGVRAGLKFNFFQ